MSQPVQLGLRLARRWPSWPSSLQTAALSQLSLLGATPDIAPLVVA